MAERSTHSTRFRWQIAIAAILALILLSLSIPEVRASLSAWLGLSIAPSNQMPAASVTLAAVTPPTTSTTPATIELLEISQLSTQAGWEVLTPSYLPDSYQYKSGYYDLNQKLVILTYLVTRPLPDTDDPSLTESKSITLLQAQANDFVPMQVAPETEVIDVQVNGQPAAYAVGAWDTEFVTDDQEPSGGKMVSTWRDDLPVKNLYWQVGEIYLTLATDDEAVSQQELIDIAASTGAL